MRELAIDGVRKSFGPTVALSGVSVAARGGEVHAIIGENGAGKSTLMAVLSGAVSPDEGTMRLDGAPYRPQNPRAARAAGVAMVHQELSLCPHLTVAENIALGDEPTAFGLLKLRELRVRVEAVLRRVLGDDALARLRPDAKVGDLSPGDQQLVEIARGLAAPSCRVIILDEPTSSLASDDAERLFALVRRLRSEGMTILYISHFLEELKSLADRFTVLRDGAVVGTGDMASTSLDDIVVMMAGRKLEQVFARARRGSARSEAPGEVLLTVEGLAGAKKPVDASFTLRRGEILGIAGLVGAGRTELLRAIFALDPVRRGTVKVGAYSGASRGSSPARRLAEGVGLLSEDRKREGLAMSLSIADNVTLSKLPGFFVSPRRQRDAAERWKKGLAIRCRDVDQPVSDLSGGNQQKVALARLLHHDVDVFLLDEPTRGIDVGSKAQIYDVLERLVADQKAVLIVSSYLPELFGVCDRVAVMSRGRLGPARPIADWDEQAMLKDVVGAC